MEISNLNKLRVASEHGDTLDVHIGAKYAKFPKILDLIHMTNERDY